MIGIAGVNISFADLTIVQTDTGALISTNDFELAIISDLDANIINNADNFIFV